MEALNIVLHGLYPFLICKPLQQLAESIIGDKNQKRKTVLQSNTKKEATMGRINKDAAAQLVASICREKLWANPEETAEWLKTENGQRIAALIEKERRKARG